jgi:hypothetical protein
VEVEKVEKVGEAEEGEEEERSQQKYSCNQKLALRLQRRMCWHLRQQEIDDV